MSSNILDLIIAFLSGAAPAGVVPGQFGDHADFSPPVLVSQVPEAVARLGHLTQYMIYNES